MAHKVTVKMNPVLPDGKLPIDVRDTEIESDEFRRRLPDDEGWLAVAILPGDDAIGDLTFNVQFESAKGKYEQCMEGHNQVLDETAGQIRALLEEIGGDWEIDRASDPCSKAKLRANLVEAGHRIQTGVTVSVVNVPGPKPRWER